jgi:hypothetical protein
MATIAVFGVLAGGGAYAAYKIGPSDISKNAVRSKHIKKGQVKTADLARAPAPQNLTLQNGWTAFSGIRPPGATKDAFGFVHLVGALDGSASTADTFTTLPAKFRPPAAVAPATWLTLGTTNGAFDPKNAGAQIDNGTGAVTLYFEAGANKNFVNLEGTTFYVGP